MNFRLGFINDIYIRRIFSNPINKDYITKLFLALENDNNIKVLEVVDFKILNNELNNYSDLSNRVTDSYFKVYTTKGPILLNTEFNSQRSKKSYNKNNVYICHMLLKIFDEETKESYYKAVQLNINNYDRYRKGKFIYKEDLIRKYDNDEEYILTIYDINVAILRKLSYDDIRKLDRLGAKYLSLIFISNDEIMFKGDEMMLRIVKELNELSKTLDELLYYDPDKFKKEAALEDVTDEFRKEAVLETVTDEFRKEAVLETVTDEFKKETVLENVTDEFKKETVLENVTDEFKKETVLETVTDEFKKEAVLENVTDEFKKEVVTEAVIEENKIATAKELIKNAVSKEIILKSTDITEDKYNELLDEVNKETNKK